MGGGLVRGEFVDPAQARTRFDDWAEAWWQTTTGLRPTTRRIYRDLLDCHVMPYFAGRKVGSIDYTSVELWLADRRKAGLSPKTVRECLSVLSLIVRFAVKSKAVSQNAAAGRQAVNEAGRSVSVRAELALHRQDAPRRRWSWHSP
jgi:site-specific recombinase XerC